MSGGAVARTLVSAASRLVSTLFPPLNHRYPTTSYPLLVFLLVPHLAPAQIAKFRVRETAGYRRFGYPVRASFKSDAGPLQLLENGKPIPAQFTALDGHEEVDFNVSLGPGETREYRVEKGETAMGAGVSITEDSGVFVVRHGLEFDVPDNLIGFLNQVKTGKLSYLRPGSQGLLLNYKDDIEFRAGGTGHWGERTKARITKRGPLVGALRFESTEGLRSDRAVKSVVDLDFPRSKAWVEVRWVVDDPERWITGMIADLNLLVDGPPTLVDFGANDTVYAALKPDQHFVLSSGAPGWFVHLNGESYASSAKSTAEGWAHVMDMQRATAIAVAGFGDDTRDRIEVSSDGHLRIRREFPGGGDRTLHFWLHFVTMPVQVGAATSPQAMQTPLRVDSF
jgi:hypothetical protein